MPIAESQPPRQPVVVEFPLRGEWNALNTPGERVPSHGTDFFGQRYAFDFVQMDASATWYYPGEVRALARHLTIGLPASRFYCWARKVHATAAGRVVRAVNDVPDRRRVQFAWELLRVAVVAPWTTALAGDEPLAGNHVIVEGEEGFALYAHLRQGSVTVSTGDRLQQGDVIGEVGNSGNSTMPHLHFQLMNGPNPREAAGIPCIFRMYERFADGAWAMVERDVPAALERIRSIDPAGATTR